MHRVTEHISVVEGHEKNLYQRLEYEKREREKEREES